MSESKMREAFENWAKAECLDLDSIDGFYSDNDTHIAWGAWLAAQSEQSVPVVGEVVYIRKDKLQRVQQFGPSLCEIYTTPAKAGLVPLIVQPTHFISAAELERLRRIEAVMIKVSNLRFDYVTLPIIREMIDAAIAAPQNEA